MLFFWRWRKLMMEKGGQGQGQGQGQWEGQGQGEERTSSLGGLPDDDPQDDEHNRQHHGQDAHLLTRLLLQWERADKGGTFYYISIRQGAQWHSWLDSSTWTTGGADAPIDMSPIPPCLSCPHTLTSHLSLISLITITINAKRQKYMLEKNDDIQLSRKKTQKLKKLTFLRGTREDGWIASMAQMMELYRGSKGFKKRSPFESHMGI